MDVFDPCEHTDNVKVHAILLILGWGFLIPVSVFTLTHLSHREDDSLAIFGRHLHMAIGLLGAILAIAGFAFGMEKFSTLTRDKSLVPSSELRYTHAITGIIATVGCITNLCLFVFMRPKQRRGERSLMARFGHLSHRIIGGISMAAAFIALETGTHMASIDWYTDLECGNLEKQDDKWTASLIGTYLATFLITMLSVNGAVRSQAIREDQASDEQDPKVIPMGDCDEEEGSEAGTPDQ